MSNRLFLLSLQGNVRMKSPFVFRIPKLATLVFTIISRTLVNVRCWTFLHDFGKIGKQQKDLIYLYMEQRGIKEDGTCWDSIAKIYQRLRKNYLTNQCKRKNSTIKNDSYNKVETEEIVE